MPEIDFSLLDMDEDGGFDAATDARRRLAETRDDAGAVQQTQSCADQSSQQRS